MKKLHDWQIRYEAFLLERTNVPFVWGANDCATFAADCVMAITGIDPAPKGLRKHTTALQASRVLKRHGGLSGIATAALGEPVPVSQAQVGDVLLVPMQGREALAICNGATAFGPSAYGLTSVDVGTALKCWRVA